MESGAYGYMDQREKGKKGESEREKERKQERTRTIGADIRKEERRTEEQGKKWRDERN